MLEMQCPKCEGKGYIWSWISCCNNFNRGHYGTIQCWFCSKTIQIAGIYLGNGKISFLKWLKYKIFKL